MRRDTSLNRTQQLTSDWLQQSGLQGDDLLLEALLRRGFLALRDDQGVWLGTGSHPADIAVLRLIEELEIVEISGHADRMAAIRLRPFASESMVAQTIVCLPEHNRGTTGFGPGGWQNPPDESFARYSSMVWGAKRPVCPAKTLNGTAVYDALDTGIALLVKTLPLARVATSLSCDGHGERPAFVSLWYEWDVPWGEVVFQTLGPATLSSRWDWIRGNSESELEIWPIGGYSNEGIMGMLHDIQRFARCLMDQNVIDKVGRARTNTLIQLGRRFTTIERFTNEARRQLAAEFG